MATRIKVTAEDLWRMGEGDVRRELVNGEVIEMAPVGWSHGHVTGRFYRRISDHVEARDAGEVAVGDVGFVLQLPNDPERVRAPDVAFVSKQRLPAGRQRQGFFVGGPDFGGGGLSPAENPADSPPPPAEVSARGRGGPLPTPSPPPAPRRERKHGQAPDVSRGGARRF